MKGKEWKEKERNGTDLDSEKDEDEDEDKLLIVTLLVATHLIVSRI